MACSDPSSRGSSSELCFVFFYVCVSVSGDGCRAQSYCNGHGTCDLCTSTCVCDEGYGAPDDLIEDIIAVRGISLHIRMPPHMRSRVSVAQLDSKLSNRYASLGGCVERSPYP